MSHDLLSILFPRASRDFVKANPQLRPAEPERDQAPALDSVAQGTDKGAPRIIVRFTGYRIQPLDPDNFAGSIKDLLDGLRHAHLIPGDEPWRIRLETEQEKVAHFDEERTEIEIQWPTKE